MARWRWLPRKPSPKERDEFRFVFFRETILPFVLLMAVAVEILEGLGRVLGHSVPGDMLRYLIFAMWLQVGSEYLLWPFKRKGILRVRRQARSRRRIES